MTARDFCYWLQGMFELSGPKSQDEKQTELIRRHLAMVYVHDIDPSAPADQQEALNALNSGKKPDTPGGKYYPSTDPKVIYRC